MRILIWSILGLCTIYTVNLGGARSALVAEWLARQTLKPAERDGFLGGHLLIFFSSSSSSSSASFSAL